MNESALKPGQIDEMQRQAALDMGLCCADSQALLDAVRTQQQQIDALQVNLDDLLAMLADPDGPR